MNFLELPVDLRHQIFLFLSLNDLWILGECPDRGIRITFYFRTWRYFTLRYGQKRSEWRRERSDRDGQTALRRCHIDPFQDYVETLIYSYQIHQEPELMDHHSPVLFHSLAKVFSMDQLWRRASHHHHQEFMDWIISHPLSLHDVNMLKPIDPHLSLRLKESHFDWIYEEFCWDDYKMGYLNQSLSSDEVNKSYLFGLIEGGHQESLITHRSKITHNLFRYLAQYGQLQVLTILDKENALDINTLWNILDSAIDYNQVAVVAEFWHRVDPIEFHNFLFINQTYPSRQMKDLLISLGIQFVSQPQSRRQLPKYYLLMGAVKTNDLEFFMEELDQPIPDDDLPTLFTSPYQFSPPYYLSLYLERYPHQSPFFLSEDRMILSRDSFISS